MSEQLIQCPSCGTRLTLPPNCINCVVRCARCQSRFRVSERSVVRDEDVAEWLKEGLFSHEDDNVHPQHTPHHNSHSRPVPHSINPPESGNTAVLPALTERIHMVKVDDRGAMFEFPAGCLNDTSFRIAMPRRCLQCGTRAHIRAHLIVFASQLRDSISLEAEHAAGTLVLGDDEMLRMTPEVLLSKLPKVPNVPPPGDLPMPYWICDMCSGTGVLSAQIQVNSVTGSGLCRLLIRNLRRAMEFLSAAGGDQCKSWFDLKNKVTAIAEKPWDTLPEAVQHRVQQWFRPAGMEQFLAYIPDRDHTRTEDGMAGLLVTTTRFIYHTQLRHKEAKLSETIEFSLAMSGIKGNLEIKTPWWSIKRITVDRDGMDRLRSGISASKHHVIWH